MGWHTKQGMSSVFCGSSLDWPMIKLKGVVGLYTTDSVNVFSLCVTGLYCVEVCSACDAGKPFGSWVEVTVRHCYNNIIRHSMASGMSHVSVLHYPKCCCAPGLANQGPDQESLCNGNWEEL